MNIEQLTQSGVDKVQAGGTAAAEVSTALLQQHWSSLANDAKKELATYGLARLINDEMARQRAEEEKRKEDDLRAWYEEYKNRPDVAKQRQEEKERREAEQKRTQEESARIAAQRADPAYRKKVERIHAEIHCPYKACREGSFERIEWCVRFILKLPEEQQEAEIARRRKLNDGSFDLISEAIEFSAEAGYARALANMRSIMLVASDGTMKSLLDFSLADVKKWRKRSKSLALSWQERREWFREAERLLTEAGADCISDLTPEQIGQLAQRAEAIWKKKQGAGKE